MKKDVAIAISVGFASGALVSVLLLNLPSIISFIGKSREDIKNPFVSTNVSPTISTPASPLLDINAPSDNFVSADKSIPLSGKTDASNTIVLEYNLSQDVLTATGDGSFTFPLSLYPGSNEIIATVYNGNGESQSKTITILYQDEKL